VGERYHSLAEAHLEQGKPVHENHLSLISKEDLDEFLKRNNSDLAYGDFRRSVITQGIDLNALVGKKFRVGNAVCYGVEPCEPCSYLSKTVHRKVLPELVNKGGLRATVLESGTIETGSEIVAMQG
jgi:MOSC domain-containing protein YiiM